MESIYRWIDPSINLHPSLARFSTECYKEVPKTRGLISMTGEQNNLQFIPTQGGTWSKRIGCQNLFLSRDATVPQPGIRVGFIPGGSTDSVSVMVTLVTMANLVLVTLMVLTLLVVILVILLFYISLSSGYQHRHPNNQRDHLVGQWTNDDPTADAQVAMCLHGSPDPLTAALHILLGDSMQVRHQQHTKWAPLGLLETNF